MHAFPWFSNVVATFKSNSPVSLYAHHHSQRLAWLLQVFWIRTQHTSQWMHCVCTAGALQDPWLHHPQHWDAACGLCHIPGECQTVLLLCLWCIPESYSAAWSKSNLSHWWWSTHMGSHPFIHIQHNFSGRRSQEESNVMNKILTTVVNNQCDQLKDLTTVMNNQCDQPKTHFFLSRCEVTTAQQSAPCIEKVRMRATEDSVIVSDLHFVWIKRLQATLVTKLGTAMWVMSQSLITTFGIRPYRLRSNLVLSLCDICDDSPNHCCSPLLQTLKA